MLVYTFEDGALRILSVWLTEELHLILYMTVQLMLYTFLNRSSSSLKCSFDLIPRHATCGKLLERRGFDGDRYEDPLRLLPLLTTEGSLSSSF